MMRAQTRRGSINPFRDGAALVSSILAPLVLYVLTMPRTVVLEDDGLFLMVGAHLGVAHPPGYPLYTLIVYLFTLLPFGSAAFLGHLSSATLGALACGCVYVCGRLIGASFIPALTGSLLFAASEHFWAQAIVTEVYNAQCAVLLRRLRTAIVWRPTPSSHRYLDGRRRGLTD